MPSIKRNQIAGMNIHYLYYSLDYFFDAQQRAGIKSIELWGGVPHFWMDSLSYDDCQSIRKRAAGRDLDIVVFTPECAMYQYLLCASDPYQHSKSMAYFKLAIKATADLGAKVMGINAIGGNWDEDPALTWRRCTSSLFELCRVAEQEGIILALETVRPEESLIVTRLPELKRILKEVAHPSLKALLDVIAMGVAGETPQQWFQALGENIIHTHFVDGRPYGHLIWGDGCYPLDKYLQVLNDNHYLGFLGQEITDSRYYIDPSSADLRNMKAFSQFIEA